jgi:hypothetical protein
LAEGSGAAKSIGEITMQRLGATMPALANRHWPHDAFVSR